MGLKKKRVKIMLELTIRELTDIANVFHDADHDDCKYDEIRDRKYRKIMKEGWQRRHRLWRKIIGKVERSRRS